MLSLERALTIDGISVFRDHADPNQFWYLPGPVRLARREGTNQPAISFMKYKPAVADGGVKGGGFAMLETTIDLPDNKRNRILSAIMAEPGATSPNLAAVPFETGTVQCIALNIQGGGGTNATPAPEGAFNAVESILGATTPSLDAQNRAAFSLTLSQEGATILDQAFTQGLAPIGVVYSLTYSAMRPALDIEITADYERVFQQFSASIEGQYMFFKAGIEAGFEKLKQTGAIQIKVISFTDDQDEKDKEKWALDFFRDQLLADWFEPSLHPGTLAGQPAGGAPGILGLPGGATLPGTGGSQPGTPARPAGAAAPATPSQPGAPAQPNPGAAGGAAAPVNPSAPASPSGSPPRPAAPGAPPRPAAPGAPPRPAAPAAPAPAGPAGAAGPPQPSAPPAAARANAVLAPAPGNSPPGAGRGVSHNPSPTGTSETITVTGPGAVVTVDGAAVALSPGGTFTVDVPAGPPKTIAVNWPAANQSETFLLYFEFDKPDATGWSDNPPSQSYRDYVSGNSAADTRFMDNSGVSDGGAQGNAVPWSGTERGGARLRAWLGTLATPKSVTIDAHASFEQQPQPGSTVPILAEPDRQDHNMRLSDRRKSVATGIVGTTGGVALATPPQAHGDAEARGDPANPATGDPNDRVVKIIGNVASGTPGRWQGTIARAAAPSGGTVVPPTAPTTPPGTPGQPTRPGTPATPPTGTPARPATPAAQPAAPGAAVSFKLRFVHQEERKKVTLRYNRSEAVRRVYAPQGFVGLLLSEIENAASFKTEIDLDDPFFREFEIMAEAPGDFNRIGLTTAQAAIDYGKESDQAGVKHHDFVFRPGDQGPKSHSFFLSEKRDLEYWLIRQFHFDPASGWDAPQSSYDIPQTSTADRTLLLSPSDVLDFLEVGVVAGDIDGGIVERIEATLSIEGPADFTRSSTFTVLPDSQPQTWRVRVPRAVSDEDARTMTYTLKHHLKDGSVRDDKPVTTAAGRVIVHDPFPTALEIILVPLFGDGISEAFAEIQYDDEDNDYHRLERVKAKGDVTEDVPQRIALLNPDHRECQIRFTFIGKDQSVKSGAFFKPDGTIVPWKP
jgi:hypothetical protein